MGQRPSRAGELLRSIRSILKALVLLGLEPVKKTNPPKDVHLWLTNEE